MILGSCQENVLFMGRVIQKQEGCTVVTVLFPNTLTTPRCASDKLEYNPGKVIFF